MEIAGKLTIFLKKITELRGYLSTYCVCMHIKTAWISPNNFQCVENKVDFIEQTWLSIEFFLYISHAIASKLPSIVVEILKPINKICQTNVTKCLCQCCSALHLCALKSIRYLHNTGIWGETMENKSTTNDEK